MIDLTQLDTTLHNQKSGQEVAKQKLRALPKTHVDYWKQRLERRCYTRNGKTTAVNELSVRIKFKGQRRSLALATNNRDAAAEKTKKFYLSLVASGWDNALKEHGFVHSPPEKPAEEPTIGAFLAEVEAKGLHDPKTFRRYSQYFRMIVAGIKGIDGSKSKYDYKNGGLAAWRAKVDAVLLAEITPEAAEEWKSKYLAPAKRNPQIELQAKRSFNAALRNAKSLFSKNVLCSVGFKIRVPKFKVRDSQSGEREVFWFEALKAEKPGSMKFRAPEGITYKKLLKEAGRELRTDHPDSYVLFLLCLCAGLRRAEADVLLTTQLQKSDNSIRIEVNEYIKPKQNSVGTVYVDPKLMSELYSFKARAKGKFLVNSHRVWKRTTYTRYRCESHWKKLMLWLEKKGITSTKKNHELRKLFGDTLCKENGIYAASTQLRHSTIKMTESHYTDPRQRAVIRMDELLSGAPAVTKKRKTKTK